MKTPSATSCVLRLMFGLALGSSMPLQADPAPAAAAQAPSPAVEKPRLAPRALPGVTQAEAATVPVVPFSPPVAVPPEAVSESALPVEPADMVKARIVQVRRRGTFTLPPNVKAEAAAPAVEAELSPDDSTAAEPLAEGKIRIIPRAAVEAAGASATPSSSPTPVTAASAKPQS